MSLNSALALPRAGRTPLKAPSAILGPQGRDLHDRGPHSTRTSGLSDAVCVNTTDSGIVTLGQIAAFYILKKTHPGGRHPLTILGPHHRPAVPP